jgi:copper(I)-binding protein
MLAGCSGDDGIKISDAWAPATPPGTSVGAVYMRIESAKADSLIGARTSIAQNVEMHRTSFAEGMAQMRKVDSVIIAPRTPLVLETGGLHMMLLGLSGPLEAGQTFKVTLSFQHAGDVTVEVHVASSGDAPHSHH